MLNQTMAITGINVRSIPERWAPSLVIVIGLAGVVAVFTALLAMSTGFESTLKAAGRTDVAIVMRGGSDSELNSGLGRDDRLGRNDGHRGAVARRQRQGCR
jgi:putative ABC transport system permease protein